MKTKVLYFIFCITVSFPAFSQNFQDVVEAESEEELDNICKSASLGFMNTPRDIEDAVNGILKTVGIKNISDAAFILKDCPQINNAVAKILKDENGKDVRYVLYDPNLLQNIINQTNDSWSAKFVLAHEIGHHMLGHSLNNGSSNHKYELDADYWAGRALSLMGASEEETISATMILPERASASHPARSERLEKATEGWSSVEKSRTIKVSDENIDEIGRMMVMETKKNLKENYSMLSVNDFTNELAYLDIARTKYYKAYTEDIRYLESICLTGMREKERAETAYINYLSIENLDDQDRIKQIADLYVESNTSKSSFFNNPEVLYQLSQAYYSTERFEKAMNYANQFQQFIGDTKNNERVSEINKIIALSERGMAFNNKSDLERGYQAYDNGEYLKAFEILQSGIKAEDAKSELLVGQMYLSGKGVTQDTNKAFELLFKSSQRGNAEAQYLIGVMFKDGNGTSHDFEEAKYWLTKASEQGHSQANKELKVLLRENILPKTDNTVPEKIEENNREETEAEKMAKYILNGDSYFNKSMFTDAYAHFLMAAKQGNAYAQEKVAWMLFKGKGVPKDKDTGLDWWRKAAKQGNIDAINILTRLGEW